MSMTPSRRITRQSAGSVALSTRNQDALLFLPPTDLSQSQIQRFDPIGAIGPLNPPHITYKLFSVQGVLFEAPEYRFVAEAAGFLKHPTQIAVGEIWREAIVLDDVSPTDFAALLQYFYSPKDLSLSIQEWTSILHLTTRYRALELRQKSIGELSKPLHLSSLEKVVLGRECHIPTWFRSGLLDIMQSEDKGFPDRTIHTLGLDMTVRIYRALEGLYNDNISHCKSQRPTRSPSEELRGRIVEDIFHDELRAPSRSPTDPITQYWLAKQQGLSDLMKSSLTKIVGRPESIAYDEVKGHHRDYQDVLKMLRARLRCKREQAKFPEFDDYEYGGAFDEEFGEDYTRIVERSQAFDVPRSDDARLFLTPTTPDNFRWIVDAGLHLWYQSFLPNLDTEWLFRLFGRKK